MDNEPKASRAKRGRGMGKSKGGDFFAVDRRAWPVVAKLGMNAMVAYLLLARGTGPDNRSSCWSVCAIERRSGVSRSRAGLAIKALREAAVIVLDPSSDRCHPKYKLAPAHEIPGSRVFPPPRLNKAQTHILGALGDHWTHVPAKLAPNDAQGVSVFPRLPCGAWCWSADLRGCWAARKSVVALTRRGMGVAGRSAG